MRWTMAAVALAGVVLLASGEARAQQCTMDTDCATNADGHHCDTTIKLCGCTADTDCTTGTTCDMTFGVCSCAMDAQCTTSGDGHKCDPASHICGCAADTDCAPLFKCMGAMAPALGFCVPPECTTDTDCAMNAKGPKCDPTAHTCGCAAAADCAMSTNGTACKTDKTCGCAMDT